MSAHPPDARKPRSWHPESIGLPLQPTPDVSPTPPDGGSALVEPYRQRLHAAIVKTIDFAALNALPADHQRVELLASLNRLLAADPPPFGQREQDRLVHDLLDDILGLGPLEPLLREPGVNDILVNGAGDVYVERGGRLERTDVRFRDDAHVMQIVDRIVSRIGRRVDEASPMVDARLPDGSRVNVIVPPLSVK